MVSVMIMLAFFSSRYYINDNQLVLGGFNFYTISGVS